MYILTVYIHDTLYCSTNNVIVWQDGVAVLHRGGLAQVRVGLLHSHAARHQRGEALHQARRGTQTNLQN